MCGIFAYLSPSNPNDQTNNTGINLYTALQETEKINHRGPDNFGYEVANGNIFIHKRLSIIDPKSGHQPLKNLDGSLILTVNGEIFNYKLLKQDSRFKNYPYQTKSDCEVILAVYQYYANKFYENCITNELLPKEIVCQIIEQLDGQFSFVLYDKARNHVLVARDPFGITSLYWGATTSGAILISSEMKALTMCQNVSPMPAGHYLYWNNIATMDPVIPVNYFNVVSYGKWIYDYLSGKVSSHPDSENQEKILSETLNIFTRAVEKRMMSDVPFGVLLSGGLDSSLVASITSILMKENPEIYGHELHTFSIGLPNAPDLLKARVVADHIKSIHHEFTFTLEEGWDAIRSVIRQLETYDITTIRASTPMYLMSKRIKDLGFKMVLSGEGSDELLGGYLYFHQAPDNSAHQLECKRRLLELSYFDCLRADKSTMGNGLEVRVPFLDTAVVEYLVDLPMEVKAQEYKDSVIEKYIFRKAFDVKKEDGQEKYLPEEILWRQKEQFSDGVGYGWIDFLKDMTSKLVSDAAMKSASIIFPYNTPTTKEAFYYRMVFEEMFPGRESVVKKWVPNTSWAGVPSDPSGRVQKVHLNKI